MTLESKNLRRHHGSPLSPLDAGQEHALALLVALLDVDAEDFNRTSAIVLANAVLPALFWLHDHRNRPLDLGVVRTSMQLEGLIARAVDPELPEDLKQPILDYLRNLPGWENVCLVEIERSRFAAALRQNHGYIEMQWRKVFDAILIDTGFFEVR